ncbi:MAG: ribbon-helix-helix domain-containing protein [Cyclobacteriaceae bacterium]
MNISVYLPDNLKSRLDSYVKKRGMTTSGAIQKAVELLLKNESNKKWGDWINQLEPDNQFPSIEDIRMDLNPSKEDIF